jgi:hypothetical protein
VHSISQELDSFRGVELKGNYHLARDGALGSQGFGSFNAHHAWYIWHIVLPAAPGHSVTLAHQEAVARVQRFAGCHVPRIVEVPQSRPPAPVQDVQQQAVIPQLRLHWPEDTEIRGETHQALGIPGRQLQVADGPVGWMVWGNGEVDPAVKLRIWAHLAESLPLGKQ